MSTEPGPLAGTAITNERERQHMERFACRFLAETYGRTIEPTDGALAAVFASCDQQPDASYYPAIRDRINTIHPERAQ